MDKLIGIAQMVLPVFLMIAIGAICRKKRVLTREGIAGLKSIVVNVTLPAVLFKAFYVADYSMRLLIVTLAMFAACCVALGAGFGIKKLLGSNMRTQPFLMTGFEAGMLGYALYTMLFGAEKITSFATVDLGQVLFVFSVFFALIDPSKKQNALSSTLKNIFTSPVMLSILAGIALGVTGLGKAIAATPVGSVVDSVLSFLAAPTGAVILLVVGYELEWKPAALKGALSSVAARLVLMAALGALVLVGLGALVPVDEPLKWAIILMFTLPPPFVIPIFVDSEQENGIVSATLSLFTLVSLALFAVIASIAA